MDRTQTITIPGCAHHNGFHVVTVTLPWRCAVCKGARGELFGAHSYDGSRRLSVSGWKNPCGHVETYRDVRESLRLSCPGDDPAIWPHG